MNCANSSHLSTIHTKCFLLKLTETQLSRVDVNAKPICSRCKRAVGGGGGDSSLAQRNADGFCRSVARLAVIVHFTTPRGDDDGGGSGDDCGGDSCGDGGGDDDGLDTHEWRAPSTATSTVISFVHLHSSSRIELVGTDRLARARLLSIK